MKVLVLAPNPEISGPFPGPIARIAYCLVDALRESGCVVETELWGRHEAEETTAARVAGRAGDLARIWRRIKAGGYDIVFVNTTHDLRAVVRDVMMTFSLSRRVPWVFLFHGSKPNWFGSPEHKRFTCATWLLLRRARTLLVLSREEARLWEAFSPRTSVHVVSNPFLPSGGAAPRRDERDGPLKLLFAGRLTPEKGLHELLEATAQVVQEEECTLLIAGEGEIKDDLRRRAADLGLQDRVTFPGFLDQEELNAVYDEADMLVLPSYYGEGFPTVISEAMSHGLPVVTTPIRGAADHLVDRENVLFVPPRSPRELAQAILTLLRDGPLRRQIGENNLGKVRDFAPERVVQDYIRVFEQVAGRARSS